MPTTAAIIEFRRALEESDADTLKFFANVSDRRLRQRRASHASALIQLCRWEMAALANEPVEDRRERLRREADRAEYRLKEFRASERGDFCAAQFYRTMAAAT